MGIMIACRPPGMIWAFVAEGAPPSSQFTEDYRLVSMTLLFLALLAILAWVFIKLKQRGLRLANLVLADQLKNEFFSNTVKVLRNPLTGILRLSRSLQEDGAGKLDPEAHNTLNRIIASGQDLEQIVEDLETYAGVEPEKHPLVFENTNMHEVVNGSLALVSVPAAAKGVKLRNDLQARAPHVRADKPRLQHILTFLLDQVLERMEMGSIVLDGNVSGDLYTLSITGKGNLIPEMGVSDARTKVEDNQQVNLAVVKRLVDQHEGRLKIQTQEENQVVVSLSLPLARQGEQVEANKRLDPVEPNSDFLRIIPNPENFNPADFTVLIVDDDLINRRVLVNYLITANYRVREASGGEEGLGILKNEGPFDLVLLDIMMPGMTGYDMCREIRKDYPIHELPVVFLTAKDQKADLAEGFSSGANDYMAKPFDWPELLSRVRIHLQLLDIHRTLEKRIADRTRDLHARHGEMTDAMTRLETENKGWTLLESAIQAVNDKTGFYEVVHEILQQGFKLLPGAAKAVCLQWDNFQRKFTFMDTIGYELEKLEQIRFNGEALIERLTAREEPVKPGIYLGKNFEHDGQLRTDIPIPKATLAMQFTLEHAGDGYLVWDNPVNVQAFDQADVDTLSYFRIHAYQALNKAWTRQQSDLQLAEYHQSRHFMQRIQSAGRSIPKAQLPDHFTIFKSKGMTSGDLFWIREKNGTVFLSVIDSKITGFCGSFMAQTTYRLLDRAYFQFCLENPGRILENLHTEFRNDLGGGGEDENLGEELNVSLCRIERDMGRVVFASAGLPLVRVRPGEDSHQLEVLNGTPHCIGCSSPKKPRFENRELEISSGEMVYLASDGFVKQTNADNLKYGKRRFHSFLKSIADRNIATQKEMLLEELANYSGEEAQSEDIIVIGLRL